MVATGWSSRVRVVLAHTHTARASTAGAVTFQGSSDVQVFMTDMEGNTALPMAPLAYPTSNGSLDLVGWGSAGLT